ncbi:hypothetical protein ACFL2C_02135 [Patescibacteria group bacterium]
MRKVAEFIYEELDFKRCDGCPYVVSIVEKKGHARPACPSRIALMIGEDPNVAPTWTGRKIPETCDFLFYDPDGNILSR